MKLIHIVGARPNFMKMTPVWLAFQAYDHVEQLVVHTGQHYDHNMSQVFFEQLGLSKPDINLEVGSGSHAKQTAEIMIRCEGVMQAEKPDLVLVYGDVNSTVSAAMVCAKLWIPVAHVEAGLRSFDRRMPEEINRLMTDQISDMLFTPSEDGNDNLKREGVADDKVHLVGNAMIDTLVRLLPQAEAANIHREFDISENNYALVTLHRPSNVDDETSLKKIMQTLSDISTELPIIFPVHPRTRHKLGKIGIQVNEKRLRLFEPLGYLDFLRLQKYAKVVITDSGGIQEETTYLKVPCLTLRKNTERPITVTVGTNKLLGHDMPQLQSEVKAILDGKAPQGDIPFLWDGKTGDRIAKIITENLNA